MIYRLLMRPILDSRCLSFRFYWGEGWGGGKKRASQSVKLKIPNGLLGDMQDTSTAVA